MLKKLLLMMIMSVLMIGCPSSSEEAKDDVGGSVNNNADQGLDDDNDNDNDNDDDNSSGGGSSNQGSSASSVSIEGCSSVELLGDEGAIFYFDCDEDHYVFGMDNGYLAACGVGTQIHTAIESYLPKIGGDASAFANFAYMGDFVSMDINLCLEDFHNETWSSSGGSSGGSSYDVDCDFAADSNYSIEVGVDYTYAQIDHVDGRSWSAGYIADNVNALAALESDICDNASLDIANLISTYFSSMSQEWDLGSCELVYRETYDLDNNGELLYSSYSYEKEITPYQNGANAESEWASLNSSVDPNTFTCNDLGTYLVGSLAYNLNGANGNFYTLYEATPGAGDYTNLLVYDENRENIYETNVLSEILDELTNRVFIDQ